LFFFSLPLVRSDSPSLRRPLRSVRPHLGVAIKNAREQMAYIGSPIHSPPEPVRDLPLSERAAGALRALMLGTTGHSRELCGKDPPARPRTPCSELGSGGGGYGFWWGFGQTNFGPDRPIIPKGRANDLISPMRAYLLWSRERRNYR
jgi:hypothetical protein